MKKSTLILTTLTLLFLFTFPPAIKATCYYPTSSSFQMISCSSCEEIGFTLNFKSSLGTYCMDKNCVTGFNSLTYSEAVRCKACAQNFYISGSFCMPCPSGATCDGYTIQCGEGYFSNGSSCQQCNSSCKTCSGAGTDDCTSCNSEYYLSGNTCLACPSNAACNGSSFTCNTGYSKADGACVADQQEPAQTNTVNSCPSRMTLSADGCCCINK